MIPGSSYIRFRRINPGWRLTGPITVGRLYKTKRHPVVPAGFSIADDDGNLGLWVWPDDDIEEVTIEEVLALRLANLRRALQPLADDERRRRAFMQALAEMNSNK